MNIITQILQQNPEKPLSCDTNMCHKMEEYINLCLFVFLMFWLFYASFLGIVYL